MRNLGLTVAFLLLALCLPAIAQPPSPIMLPTSEGPKGLVGVNFQWFARGAQTIKLGHESGAAGNGQVDTTQCLHSLDLDRLKHAALAMLRQRGLTPNLSLVEGQLFILTTPKLSWHTAIFYSFTAAMDPCVNECFVRVSASKLVAPYEGSYIDMERSTKLDDDITGSLMDVGETEFSRCRRHT